MAESKENPSEEKKPICGIVMPISPIDGCSAEHWLEVQGILRDVIKKAGFEPNLVSDSDESGIIQKRIIQNLYNNEIVVCDVSAKNPNVMFELGLRLAFDKPTIIIKDDQTDYSFDTSVIEHVPYPRDLRFTKIVNFREILQKKITSTFKASSEDDNYTTFLKHFGEFTVANLGQKEVSPEKYVLESLDELRQEIEKLSRGQQTKPHSFQATQKYTSDVVLRVVIKNIIQKFAVENNLQNWRDIFDLNLENKLLDIIKLDPRFRKTKYTDQDLLIAINDVILE